MRKILSAGAAMGLLLVAGCGGEEANQDGITAKERSDLDNAAAMLDGNQIVDTSADSLVLDENAAEAAAPLENGAAAAGNEAADLNQVAAP